MCEEVVVERCGRSSRECACRGRTQSSSSLVYAQLRVAEVTHFLSVWFWSLCGLRVCRKRVCRECGGLRTSTVHCLCSWKVREGRTASERVVVPLQSLKLPVFYCEQIKISHRCRLRCHCMCFLSVLQCLGCTDTVYGTYAHTDG